LKAVAGSLAASLALASAWGVGEAMTLRRRVLDVPLERLPQALDGLRVLHLSDVHAGYGPGLRTFAAAVEWSSALRPDIAVITGDLVARPGGEERFRAGAAALAATTRYGAFAVLGNHDFAIGNDPFAAGQALSRLEGVELLGAERRVLSVHGHDVCVVGADAYAYLHDRSYDVSRPRSPEADVNILLCHYPHALERVGRGEFDLILSGHLHGGQICVPGPRGRVGLAHPRERYLSGLYHADGTTMHVSPGLGTTFVPFRVLARPEATLLVLRSAASAAATDHAGAEA
jgi:uncharacterized protein